MPMPVMMPIEGFGVPYMPAPNVLPTRMPTVSTSGIPDGWVIKFSRTFQREFYECPATGEKRWTLPHIFTKSNESEMKAPACSSRIASRVSTDKALDVRVKGAEPSNPKETKDGTLDSVEVLKSQNNALVQKIASLEKDNETLKLRAAELEDDLKRSSAKCDLLQKEKDSLAEKLTDIAHEMEKEKDAMLAQVDAQQESITTLHAEIKNLATDVAVISPAIQHLVTVRDEHQPPAFPQEGQAI
jgi:predicted RNase H-like nuclease (RuvC/YqgF family)